LVGLRGNNLVPATD
jgi:hypothetical protein